MTRPELHALVDIVMDARERGKEIEIRIDSDATMVDWGNHHPYRFAALRRRGINSTKL